jgi:hypothetical protein
MHFHKAVLGNVRQARNGPARNGGRRLAQVAVLPLHPAGVVRRGQA